MKLFRDFSIVCLLAIIIMGTSIGLVLSGNIVQNATEQVKIDMANAAATIGIAYLGKNKMQKPKIWEKYHFSQKIKEIKKLQKDILGSGQSEPQYVSIWSETTEKQTPNNKETIAVTDSHIINKTKNLTGKIKDMFLHDLNGTMVLNITLPSLETNGKPVSLEIRKKLKDTFIKVRIEQKKLWYMLGSGFLCLYLSLILIVFRAAKHLKGLVKDTDLTKDVQEAVSPETSKVLEQDRQVKENNENQIINKSAILEYAGGEKEILEAIIEVFIKDSEKLLSQISSAIKEENSKLLEGASNSLKRSLEDLSARAAYNAAIKLEKIGKADDISHAEEAYTSLKKEIERLKPKLTEISQEI